jgi:putative mycofactocin binding protein MftB
MAPTNDTQQAVEEPVVEEELVTVVSGLEQHASVHAAIDAAGVDEAQRPAYLRALAGLAANGTIEERP